MLRALRGEGVRYGLPGFRLQEQLARRREVPVQGQNRSAHRTRIGTDTSRQQLRAAMPSQLKPSSTLLGARDDLADQTAIHRAVDHDRIQIEQRRRGGDVSASAGHASSSQRSVSARSLGRERSLVVRGCGRRAVVLEYLLQAQPGGRVEKLFRVALRPARRGNDPTAPALPRGPGWRWPLITNPPPTKVPMNK